MKIINRVLTALGNPTVAEELKKSNINIVTNDIQYQEGIIEYLHENKNLNFIIIDEKIPGYIGIEKLINNIRRINKNIKIILISENNDLKANKVLRTINTKEIVNIIQKNNIFNKTYLPINDVFNEHTNDAEIITILGTNGIGKSIFSIAFASQEKEKNVLVIDFDIVNNDLHNMLNVKQYSKKIKKQYNYESSQINSMKDFIIQTKFNIDLLSGINLIFNSKKQPNSNKIKKLILELKKEYDLIIIDTAPTQLLDYTKELINISNNTIFISGANKIEIKKSINLIELYKQECNITNRQINIIFNKWTPNSFSDDVLQNIFRNYKILGKIKLSDYYDIAINKNISKIPQIQKEIRTIKEKYYKKIKKKRKRKVKYN